MDALIVGRVWAGSGGAGMYLGLLNIVALNTSINNRSERGDVVQPGMQCVVRDHRLPVDSARRDLIVRALGDCRFGIIGSIGSLTLGLALVPVDGLVAARDLVGPHPARYGLAVLVAVGVGIDGDGRRRARIVCIYFPHTVGHDFPAGWREAEEVGIPVRALVGFLAPSVLPSGEVELGTCAAVRRIGEDLAGGGKTGEGKERECGGKDRHCVVMSRGR
jgi:hypothetical protein